MLLRFFTPMIRMSMQIPVLQSFVQRLGQLVKRLKPASLESQRAELLPPGFDQVQPTGVLRDELNLNFRPSRQGQPHLFTGMDRQVVFNQQPTVGRELLNHLLQQLDMGGTISPRTSSRSLLARWLAQRRHAPTACLAGHSPAQRWPGWVPASILRQGRS